MRVHFVSQEKFDQATSRGIGAVLYLRPVCGAKATSRGQLDLSTNWTGVDCIKCLDRKPAATVTS
jgi:hypothetical protein